MRLFIDEAAKSGMVVEGHVQTPDGARRAIDAGIWSIAHSEALDDETHKQMAAKGIWRVGTETPFTEYRGSQEEFDETVAGLENAYENNVPLTFSTDADYYVPGMSRGEVAINFLLTWKAAGIPAPEILKAMTINGYKCSQTENERGPIKSGLAADIIAVPGNPLEDIDALRNVQFVMKDGLVFKQLPYAALVMVLLPRLIRGPDRAPLALCGLFMLCFVAFFSLNTWHGGAGNNMRYFLNIVPVVAILSALALREISSVAGRRPAIAVIADPWCR